MEVRDDLEWAEIVAFMVAKEEDVHDGTDEEEVDRQGGQNVSHVDTSAESR